jgi:hypothetical protein
MYLKPVLDRLEEIEQEIQELRTGVEKMVSAEAHNDTELFLHKCRGWQDERSPDEIIAEIYARRSSSLRGTQLSHGPETPNR